MLAIIIKDHSIQYIEIEVGKDVQLRWHSWMWNELCFFNLKSLNGLGDNKFNYFENLKILCNTLGYVPFLEQIKCR